MRIGEGSCRAGCERSVLPILFVLKDHSGSGVNYILIFPPVGDEFYLVLSRLHSGKILLAYPAKYFQLEGETPTEE